MLGPVKYKYPVKCVILQLLTFLFPTIFLNGYFIFNNLVPGFSGLLKVVFSNPMVFLYTIFHLCVTLFCVIRLSKNINLYKFRNGIRLRYLKKNCIDLISDLLVRDYGGALQVLGNGVASYRLQ